jgi:hypothetical protein
VHLHSVTVAVRHSDAVVVADVLVGLMACSDVAVVAVAVPVLRLQLLWQSVTPADAATLAAEPVPVLADAVLLEPPVPLLQVRLLLSGTAVAETAALAAVMPAVHVETALVTVAVVDVETCSVVCSAVVVLADTAVFLLQ